MRLKSEGDQPMNVLLGDNTAETSSSLWAAALNAPQTSGKARGKIKKSDVVHYPEFEEASKYTDDQFWIDILKKCARKKFPREFSYGDGQLKHRQNNISIVLPDDHKALSQTVIYFIQENGKLYSKRDQENRRLEDEENDIAELANESASWKYVSYSKTRKATYVREYIERKYSHLSKSIRDEIFTQIEVGFDTKFITKDNIIFEDGYITKIDGIDATEDGVYYTRPLPKRSSTVSHYIEEAKNKQYRYHENWVKYLEGYNKYIWSSSKSKTVIHTDSCSIKSGQVDSPSE
jgi:hypothetical protein